MGEKAKQITTNPDDSIIQLFGLTNRTAILIELFNKSPLLINDIDIRQVVERYPNASSVKLSLSNSITVLRRHLTSFEESGFVYRKGKKGKMDIWYLDYNHPLIQRMIPFFHTDKRKNDFSGELDQFMVNHLEENKTSFKAVEFIWWCRTRGMAISSARASQILKKGLETARKSGLLLQKAPHLRGYYLIIRPQ
tara:strand:- start:194 stop:775 length:582 start_codon:yes stop_codon:yes gene_type:complete